MEHIVGVQTPAVVKLNIFEKQIDVIGIRHDHQLELPHGSINSDGVLKGLISGMADVF